MRRSGITVFIVLTTVAALLWQAAPSQADVKFKSAMPRFAKIALNQDASKVLSVAFDESKGTGKGYDTLYPDTNFSSAFDTSERRKAEDYGEDSDIFVFPAIKLPVPFNAKGKASHNPCSIEFMCYEIPTGRGRTTTSFSLSLTVELMQGNIPWSYDFDTEIKPAITLKSTKTVRIDGKPAIKIDAQPDNAKSGNTGIGIGLSISGIDVSCERGMKEDSAAAVVTIKDSNGNVVSKEVAPMDKFGFG